MLVRPQPNADERELVATARRLAIPLLADVDAVVLDEGERNLHGLLAAVHLGPRVDDLPPHATESGVRTLRAAADVAGLFSDLPEALLESERIAEMCSVEPLERRHLSRTGAFDAQPELERRCHGLLSRLPAARGARRAEYSRRLADELAVVRQLGLTELFSSVGALVEVARERSIPVAARGSVVSSLIGHVLGFSHVDPVEHGLYFERFVNALPASPPCTRSKGGPRTVRGSGPSERPGRSSASFCAASPRTSSPMRSRAVCPWRNSRRLSETSSRCSPA